MKNIVSFLFFILACSLIGGKEVNVICNRDRFRSFLFMKNNISFFKNFKKFSDLQMNCNQTYNITAHVHFFPEYELIVDKSLDFNKLTTKYQLFSLELVYFFKILGFDLNALQIFPRQGSVLIQNNFMAIAYSKFEIYSNERKIEHCQSETYPSNQYPIFESVNTLYFHQVVYPKSICPLLFKNSQIVAFVFADIVNSLIFKNRLKFDQIISNTSVDLNLKLFNFLYIELNYDSLTLDIINSNLFRNLKELKVLGILNNIQTDLFTYFFKLKKITLKINDLGGLFQKGNKWMLSLNNRTLMIKPLELFFIDSNMEQSFYNIYTYSNNDICLFKNFPQNRFITPYVYSGIELECTCTLKWIHLYLFEYDKDHEIIDYYEEYGVNYKRMNIYSFCKSKFESMNCDFEKFFNTCQIAFLEKDDDFGIVFRLDNDIDLFFLLKWLQFILLVILQPILCFACIITNLLVIVVIRKREKVRGSNEIMYEYICVNALFNLSYSTIIIFKLMNTCVIFYTPGYCSSIYQWVSIQHFKIFGIFFLRNVFKISSNVSYLFFAFARLASIVMSNENRFFIKFKAINIKVFTIFLIFFSGIFSSFILFQYSINYDYDYRKEFPFETRHENFCLEKTNKFQCKLFDAFKLINQIINGIIFVILNLVIDLVLLKGFKRELKRKVALGLNDLKKLEDLKQKELNLIKMIIINGSIYFMSHIPECLTTILLIIYKNKLTSFCFNKLSCDLINEQAEFFILISMIANFFIFKKFNSAFSESFNKLKSKVWSK